MAERLQKLVAAAGLASRREAEAWIEAGRVTVNGKVARLGDRADVATDAVCVDDRLLEPEDRGYWMLHKPKGVLSTRSDPHAARSGRRTALELLPEAARALRLYPVGRLDADSEGLLLLTNDGAIAHTLLHPSLGTEKEYLVTVRGCLDAAAAQRLTTGLRLEDGPMAPCRVEGRRFDPRRGITELKLTLHEGRKRQIRRAMRVLETPVVRLLRIRMGPLELGTLRSGAARVLTQRERRALRTHARHRAHRSASSRPSTPRS